VDPAERFANATEFIDALAPSGSASGARARRGIPRVLVGGIVATLIGFTVTAALVSKGARTPAATPSAPSPPATLAATVAPEGPLVTPVLDERPLPPATPASTALPPPKPTATLPTRTLLKAPSSPKRRAPSAPDAGVASSLQLSTREP
jgi:hypothetical protein